MSASLDPESYDSLLEQGLDLQRRHDAILQSRTWRLQLALSRAVRAPSALVRLPAEIWRILRSAAPVSEAPLIDLPELSEPLPATKPLVLVLVPWLRLGGAERVIVELIRGLATELDFAILPASGEGPADPSLLTATPWIFPPPQADYAGRAAQILRDNPVNCVLISSCPQAYAALPALRQSSSARIVDILHNTAPEGSLGASAAHDRYIDRHFAVGDQQADALRQAGVAPAKIAVARNGVDCHGQFRPPEAPSPLTGPGPLRIAWIGRLSDEKDPALFLRALAKLPETQGILIGDGPERFRLETLIRDLGLSTRVRITGFTSRVPQLLGACDILALTSRTEGFPLTILEAMSLEKPVVAADVGAVREAVEDGVTGCLVRDRTPEGLAAAIRLLASDPALRRRLGVNARRRVVEHFSRDAMLDSYRRELKALGVLG